MLSELYDAILEWLEHKDDYVFQTFWCMPVTALYDLSVGTMYREDRQGSSIPSPEARYRGETENDVAESAAQLRSMLSFSIHGLNDLHLTEASGV